jgi:hypothetical protein
MAAPTVLYGCADGATAAPTALTALLNVPQQKARLRLMARDRVAVAFAWQLPHGYEP